MTKADDGALVRLRSLSLMRFTALPRAAGPVSKGLDFFTYLFLD
jgi:hypothetical protein